MIIFYFNTKRLCQDLFFYFFLVIFIVTQYLTKGGKTMNELLNFDLKTDHINAKTVKWWKKILYILEKYFLTK